MTDQYKERITKFEMGAAADLDITGVKYLGIKLAGDGPGGDFLSVRTVPNTTNPIGWRHHHKWYEVIIGVDQRLYTILFNYDVETGAGTGKAIVPGGDNTALGLFKVTVQYWNGTAWVTELWTFEADKSMVANYKQDIRDGENNQIEEIKVICIGTRSVTLP